MGKRPSYLHFIDRIDVNSNYEPNNCKWSTTLEQSRNKRNSILLTFDNETKNMTEWAQIYNMHRKTLEWRLWKGMSVKQALETPIDNKFKIKRKKENELLLQI
jgi:hypothetical protein